MTYKQFWRSSFADLALRTEAYLRHNRSAAMYFRETYSLLYNINRSEKAPVLEGKDVLALHGEQEPRKRRVKSLMDDPKAMADFTARMKTMTEREVTESALFDLPIQDYLRRRAAGDITAQMVEYCMRKKYFEENPDADPDSFEMPIITDPKSLGNIYLLPDPRLVKLKAQVEAELNPKADSVATPEIPMETVNPAAVVSVPEPDSELEPEPETRSVMNSFAPLGLIGEAIPIKPSE